MKVLGLITEYNPFHNGHKYHLLKSKNTANATHTIIAMSGNFLQRGEPALINKWLRAEMAVKEGADLVVEIPTIFACNSAEYFALGGVGILDSLNIIDNFCFGSELGNLDKLEELSNILVYEPIRYKKLLKMYLSMGEPFPAARQKAISDYFDEDTYDHVLRSPNNILGIEYLRALKFLNSNITPLTIKRIKADYKSTEINGKICSATAIRTLLKNHNNKLNEFKNVIPNSSFKVLQKSIKKGNGPVFLDELEDVILYKFRTIPLKELSEIHDVSEGFENRLKKMAIQSCSFNDFIDNVKTKRFPLTRIQRIIIKTLLGITKRDVKVLTKENGPQYIRVLAFSESGTSLLKELKKKSNLPIIINLNKHNITNDIELEMIKYDILASDIYNLFTKKNKYKKGGFDFLKGPYINFKHNY